eukprot:5810993-Lingulodinium_polyedra.AAC.1
MTATRTASPTSGLASGQVGRGRRRGGPDGRKEPARGDSKVRADGRGRRKRLSPSTRKERRSGT